MVTAGFSAVIDANLRMCDNMNAPGKNFLIITGVLLLIYGLFAGTTAFISIHIMMNSTPFDQYLMSIAFEIPWRTAIVLMFILCSLSVGFGITALALRKRTDRAFIPLVQGAVLLIFNLFFSVAIEGELRLSYLDFVISAVCIFCIVGAIKNNAVANIVCIGEWIRNIISRSKY
jgi:hypothetical protein